MTHFLLESGATPILKNRLGQTPLELAEMGGFDRIAALIRTRSGSS
jgi:ankyrin repeat protein